MTSAPASPTRGLRGRPTPHQEAQLVAWVNRKRGEMFSLRRKARIRKLRPGQLDEDTACCLANSIGGRAEVSYHWWRPTPHTSGRPVPLYVTRFQERFERGDYPDLITAERSGAANPESVSGRGQP